MITKSPWFSHDLLPGSPGVYQVKHPEGFLSWRAFDGEKWYSGVAVITLPGYYSPSYYYLIQNSLASSEPFEWRGIIRD